MIPSFTTSVVGWLGSTLMVKEEIHEPSTTTVNCILFVSNKGKYSTLKQYRDITLFSSIIVGLF